MTRILKKGGGGGGGMAAAAKLTMDSFDEELMEELADDGCHR